MARRKKHEDHQNHEAWAIPYGDLITLLLAFFVVMYSMSSVNEGKYRILSDSLVAAFRGEPKSITPIQIGQKAAAGKGSDPLAARPSPAAINLPGQAQGPAVDGEAVRPPARSAGDALLERMAGQIRGALSGFIDLGDVRIREMPRWLEIEINTDILFASGDARIADGAVPVIERLAAILKPFPNPIRVEGHTDNVPIRTAIYPSNWELSAARAANVVQLFTRSGLDPLRFEIIGLGEYHPVTDNRTVAGRNRNRRVLIVVLETPAAEDDYNRQRRGLGDLERPADDAIPVASVGAGAGPAPPLDARPGAAPQGAPDG
jgi:chemotaxis protein MotB